VIINNAADCNGAQLNIKLEITGMVRQDGPNNKQTLHAQVTATNNEKGEYFYLPGYNGV
jgi:hypothetical protein